MIKLIAFDPGITGTGYAIWNRGDKHTGPSAWGEFGTSGTTVQDYCGLVGRLLNQELKDVGILEGVIENPALYNTPKGLAVGLDASFAKLYYAVGILLAGLYTKGVYNVKLYTPQAWKGTTPKEIHQKRIRQRVHGIHERYNHAVDAIGLGLYHLEH